VRNFKTALENARHAFWESITKDYPDIKSGDFPPYATYDFEVATQEALHTWLAYNDPPVYKIYEDNGTTLIQVGMETNLTRAENLKDEIAYAGNPSSEYFVEIPK